VRGIRRARANALQSVLVDGSVMPPVSRPVPNRENIMQPALRRVAALAGLLGALGMVQAQEQPLARNLAATCANCHGTNGHARGDMKPLAGVPAEKIVAMLADFRSGAQPATLMHQLSKGYTDEQIKLVAAYFAAQPAQR
jgi:sulfide dehydrogenase cytochrome subunit